MTSLKACEAVAIQPVVEEVAVDLAEDEPNGERVDTYSRDVFVDIVRGRDPYRLEHFVAGLLNAMGYRASATLKRGDGGVDVIASRDPLGLEPPIIKVQCKRTVSRIGSPEVQKLAGGACAWRLGARAIRHVGQVLRRRHPHRTNR